MNRRLLAALLAPLALLAAGCADARQSVDGARETVNKVRDCAGLASDVAQSGLSGVPSQAEAEAAVQRLEDRLANLESADVRAAATTLRDRLRDVQQAAAAADAAAVTQAVTAARDAATTAAATCGLPVEGFLTS